MEAPLENPLDNPLEDLRQRFGVTVSGPGLDERAIRTIHDAVRQFRPEDIGRLHVEVTRRDRRTGVLGTYFRDASGLGRIMLFNRRLLHVALHEVAHHMTLSRRGDVSRNILRLVAPDGIDRVARNNLPSRYARTSRAEFLAEWVSNVREMQAGLPSARGFRLSTFRPDPRGVQATNPIYARPGIGGL